jgi:NAD(P)-dependent dehydrogenase (short-subunit alcohol dehydrogenase family)
MGRLDNKVAVITGGSSGIGKGTVRLFVEEGAKVVIADIMDSHGQALADELGDAAVYIHTDVTSEAQIKAAIDLAVEKFGRLDCMFNNAGGPGGAGMIDEINCVAFPKCRLRDETRRTDHEIPRERIYHQHGQCRRMANRFR